MLESWSLCVEEWFYLVAPLLLFVLILSTAFSKRKVFLLFIFATIAIVTAVRTYVDYSTPFVDYNYWDNLIRKPTIMRMDGIMYGFLGAYAIYYMPSIKVYKNAFVVLALLMFVFLHIATFIYGYGSFVRYIVLPFESIITLLFLPKALSIVSGKGLPYKAFTFISTISYSMYLLNFTPFFRIIKPQIGRFIPNNHELPNDIAYCILFLTWTIFASYLLYRLVEKPFMAMRGKISYNEARSKVSSAWLNEKRRLLFPLSYQKDSN
jgi:peptidoglycan/LPS O-acetylase OafA/YrhL